MSDTPEAAQDSEGLLLREYWGVIVKRLWTVVLVFVVIVTGVGLYTFQQPKIYEASVTVIIDFEPPSVFGDAIDETGVGQASWLMLKQYFETQLQVIKSRHVAERVVRDHGLAENLEFLGLDKITDEEVLSRELEESDPAQQLLDMLSVEPEKETRMVHIKVQHESAQLSADLANAVAEAYRDQNIENRLQTMQDAFYWLEAQYTSYESRLNESTRALTVFKEENPLLFTSPEEQQIITNNRIKELNSHLIEVEAMRRQYGYVLKELKAFKIENLGSSGVALLTESANLSQLTEKYVDLRQEEKKVLSTYLNGTEQANSIKEQLTLVEQAIDTEVSSIRRGYQARYDAYKGSEADLRKQITSVEGEALRLDQLKLLYEQVESQKAEQERLFELVQRRLNEVSLTKLLKSNNIRILDRATVPTEPAKPRVVFNLMIAAIMGLLGGVVLAFLLEMLDTTIKTQEEVERITGMQFLGIIPTIRDTDHRSAAKIPEGKTYRPDLHVGFFPKSRVAECARTIRTNILFMSPNTPLDTILVTSASPLEGKTTTAINLATVMSQSSRKVILIEADMRRPRLYRAFGVEPVTGLSEVLIDQSTLDQAILKTEVDGLDLLPCGPIPPNPSELFHTQKFLDVLEDLKKRYDRVIIDSPPVIAVTDALILAQLVDGVILVSKAGSTRRELLKRSKELLEGISANVIGTILNNVNFENRRYGKYYYYYRRYGQYYDHSTDRP